MKDVKVYRLRNLFDDCADMLALRNSVLLKNILKETAKYTQALKSIVITGSRFNDFKINFEEKMQDVINRFGDLNREIKYAIGYVSAMLQTTENENLNKLSYKMFDMIDNILKFHEEVPDLKLAVGYLFVAMFPLIYENSKNELSLSPIYKKYIIHASILAMILIFLLSVRLEISDKTMKSVFIKLFKSGE